ncbi:MAG: hypothetical protein NTY05_07605 [Rhodocyclales bacterium]|nr:hypothetical protein [Rhodocyclales bacterium]
MKRTLQVLAVLAVLVAGYFWVVLNWSYSVGERAGWLQKLSQKGWLCKTWEGELIMVAVPGSMPEKFYFTVHDDKLAQSINRSMGKRVFLSYEEKVGLPTSCFGDTRHFVTGVTLVDEVAPATGAAVVAPAPAASAVSPAPTPGR